MHSNRPAKTSSLVDTERNIGKLAKIPADYRAVEVQALGGGLDVTLTGGSRLIPAQNVICRLLPPTKPGTRQHPSLHAEIVFDGIRAAEVVKNLPDNTATMVATEAAARKLAEAGQEHRARGRTYDCGGPPFVTPSSVAVTPANTVNHQYLLCQ